MLGSKSVSVSIIIVALARTGQKVLLFYEIGIGNL